MEETKRGFISVTSGTVTVEWTKKRFYNSFKLYDQSSGRECQDVCEALKINWKMLSQEGGFFKFHFFGSDYAERVIIQNFKEGNLPCPYLAEAFGFQ